MPTITENCIPHWRRSDKPSAHAHKQKKQLYQYSAYALFPVIKSQKPQSPHAPKMPPCHQSRSKKSRNTRMASTSLVSASTLRSVAKQIAQTGMTNWTSSDTDILFWKKFAEAAPYWCWIWWVYSMMAIPHSYTVATDHLFKQNNYNEMAALLGCIQCFFWLQQYPIISNAFRCQKVQQLFMSDGNQINQRLIETTNQAGKLFGCSSLFKQQPVKYLMRAFI